MLNTCFKGTGEISPEEFASVYWWYRHAPANRLSSNRANMFSKLLEYLVEISQRQWDFIIDNLRVEFDLVKRSKKRNMLIVG